MSTPVRIAVVDDFDVVVHGIASMLSPFPARVAVVEVETGGGPTQPVDVALIDTFGQTIDGHSLIARVARHENVGRIAVFSWTFSPELVEKAMAAGASSYLSKGLRGDALVEAIEATHHGERVVADFGPAGRTEGDRRWPGRDFGLTEREAEVLVHLSQGSTTREIADAMYLGVNSIKTHTQHLYRKIGVSNRTAAALWGVDHGFRPDRDSRTEWG